jgi:hypothetical protein
LRLNSNAADSRSRQDTPLGLLQWQPTHNID